MATTNEEWKKIPPKRYFEVAGQLVHFNGKTVNSNAQLVGIRLARNAALDLPYLSLRTLLADNVTVPLDYAAGGAAVAGVVKQINWLLSGNQAAEQANDAEKAAIHSGLEAAKNTAYSVGTELVDHRLRQLLIPKSGEAEGYVSLTPITSNGLCALLFDGESCLVTQHNEQAKKTSDAPLLELRQAQFGIGGSNPQNIGSLVRAMQHPLMLGAPRPPAELKKAFALYHSGLRFSVHRRSAFQSAAKNYVAFRDKVLLNPKPGHTITLREREQEERLVAAIAAAVLATGAAAENTLRQFSGELPHETQLPDTDPPLFALASPDLPFEMRALLDSRLRTKEWPRKMAEQTVRWMLAPHGREETRLLLLDGSARASLENMLEENFR